MPQDNPPLLDKTMNTTESTPRNLADVLASGLANIANNVKPDGSDISIDVPGMSANNVDDGFSELKQSLDGLENRIQTGSELIDFTANVMSEKEVTLPTAYSNDNYITIISFVLWTDADAISYIVKTQSASKFTIRAICKYTYANVPFKWITYKL